MTKRDVNQENVEKNRLNVYKSVLNCFIVEFKQLSINHQLDRSLLIQFSNGKQMKIKFYPFSTDGIEFGDDLLKDESDENILIKTETIKSLLSKELLPNLKNMQFLTKQNLPPFVCKYLIKLTNIQRDELIDLACSFIDKIKLLSTNQSNGYILLGEDDNFIDYSPILVNKTSKHLEFESFLEAVDTFYSKQYSNLESEKTNSAKKQNEKRLLAMKTGNNKLIKSQYEKYSDSFKAANCILYNLDIIDNIIDLINTLTIIERDWEELEYSAKDNDEYGQYIHGLKMKENVVIVKIQNSIDFKQGIDEISNDYDELVDVVDTEYLIFEISLDYSAHLNASKKFQIAKLTQTKLSKTIKSTTLVYNKILLKYEGSIKPQKEVPSLRQQFWFEKFHNFVSSDGLLILGSRDKHQSEILISQHLNSNDFYVCSDIENSCHVVIKNPNSDQNVSPNTLHQAATLALCTSTAWERGIVTSGWYNIINIGGFWVKMSNLLMG